MIDASYDTGFSREFGETAGIAAAGSTRVGRTAPPGGALDEPNTERAADAAVGRAMQADAIGQPPAHGASAATSPDPVVPLGVPPIARGGLPGPGLARPLSELAGLDLAALQALTNIGTGEPAATIARQVADMAQGLAALADKLVGQPAPSSQDVLEADCIAFLEGQFRIRRLRSRHLPGLSLGEPAWDILLDLAVAHHWRRETSVTSLCIAADVPSTTALRWINSMTKAGLIVRRPCQRDGRRSFLAIAPASYQAMLALAADALRTVDRVRSRYQRGAG